MTYPMENSMEISMPVLNGRPWNFPWGWAPYVRLDSRCINTQIHCNVSVCCLYLPGFAAETRAELKLSAAAKYRQDWCTPNCDGGAEAARQ